MPSGTFFFLHPLQFFRSKKRHLPFQAADVLRGQQADFSIFPVKSRRPLHLPFAKSVYSLRNEGPCCLFDLFYGKLSQNCKLSAQSPRHIFITLGSLFPGRRNPRGSGDHLQKGNKAFKRTGLLQDVPLFPVCKLLHPIEHSDGNLLSAHRALAAIFGCFRRTDAQPAFPVPVKMVFPFLREKFYGSCQSFSLLYCPCQPFIGQLYVEEIRLPPQLCRGMGIRIRNQMKTIQCAHPPVHGRVGRKPRLQGMNMRRQILKAFFDGVKARKSSEEGEMGRPDMGRHINSLWAGFQHNLKQITAGNPKDRPSVGMNVADQIKPPCQGLRFLQSGQEQKAVYLSHPLSLFVDGADFPGHYKTWLTLRHTLRFQPVLLFQHI